jgi:predicted dehydrogenase
MLAGCERQHYEGRSTNMSSATDTAAIPVAVIGGSGLIGVRHCQHVVETPGCVLAAIVDPNPTAGDLASKFGVPLYRNIDELLQNGKKPVAAVVCTPNHTHVPIGIQLARANIHILCEKPIAVSVSSAQTLVAEAERSGTRLLIGHHRRFNPYMLALKKLVDSGQLGSIIAVNGLWTTSKPDEYFLGANAWRKRKGSGGVVLINAIHDVDLMHYLFGPIVSVHAERTKSQRSNDLEAVEEGAAVILKFASGVIGTFIICDNVASPHSFEQGTGENPNLPITGADVYRIFGSRGTISFPDMTFSSYEDMPISWNNKLTSRKLEVPDKHAAPLALQLEHFVRVCRGTETPTCSGEEGLRALAVCEAIVSALESGGMANVQMPPLTA